VGHLTMGDLRLLPNRPSTRGNTARDREPVTRRVHIGFTKIPAQAETGRYGPGNRPPTNPYRLGQKQH
jgi:hypothetical protein